MTSRAPRRAPNLSEKLAAMIVAHFAIPREIARTMTARQLLNLVEWDHAPVRYELARELGWTDDEINHPSNLQPLLPEDHLEKTRKIDTPQAAKGKRLTREQEAFRARMLAKAGGAVAGATAAPRKPSKLKGRGFQGHRKFNGDIVRK